MLSRLKKDRVTTHKSQVSRYFHEAVVLPTNSDEQLALHNFGGPQDPGDEWALDTLNIDYGIFDDPVDENITFGLYWAVPTSSSPNQDLPAGFVWSASQNYRVLSSVGVIEATEFSQVDLNQTKVHEASSFDNENLFIGVSSSASSSIVFSGNLTYEQTLRQFTFADDLSEYEFDFLFEETLDEEEGDFL